MLIVRMPRGNAQAAVPWPSWSSYSFQLPFVVGETGVAMEAIHRVAPHADWVVVPDSLAGLHPQHQVVRIDHVAAGAPVDAPILGSSWLVGRSWITSWLAAAAWCAADSGVRRLAVARLRAPLAVLQRTAERLVALGLLEQAYSGDPELWRKVRELSGGGGQDPELEWGSSTTGPQFEEGEVLVTNDMRAAGMESLSVQDVIGDETSLRKLGLLLRLWGPYEASRLRDPENETTLPTEELWPAKWAGLEDFGQLSEERIELAFQAGRLAAVQTEVRELLATALLPREQVIWATARGIARMAGALAPLEGILTGPGDVDDKIDRIVAVKQPTTSRSA